MLGYYVLQRLPKKNCKKEVVKQTKRNFVYVDDVKGYQKITSTGSENYADYKLTKKKIS
jgi:hypothetical protein